MEGFHLRTSKRGLALKKLDFPAHEPGSKDLGLQRVSPKRRGKKFRREKNTTGVGSGWNAIAQQKRGKSHRETNTGHPNTVEKTWWGERGGP